MGNSIIGIVYKGSQWLVKACKGTAVKVKQENRKFVYLWEGQKGNCFLCFWGS